ncbi:meiotically up-regulated gene 117 protein [Mycena leptocephala]|nr:meiotically up-regulated gene 117 protein [Mycena leptocephala]
MHSSIIKAAFLAALSAAVVAAEGSILCSEAVFLPAGQCEFAYDLIVSGNTYVAGRSSSGACSGHCGVFVQSYDDTGGCSVSGSQILAAFNDIRADGCAKCGSYEFDDGCEVTINYVETC